jgi:hypothetical protein
MLDSQETSNLREALEVSKDQNNREEILCSCRTDQAELIKIELSWINLMISSKAKANKKIGELIIS